MRQLPNAALTYSRYTRSDELVESDIFPLNHHYQGFPIRATYFKLGTGYQESSIGLVVRKEAF